ncbi:FHA domain-containing protein [Kitasatospora sp. McL0602]|uniref:FHA domain-containing protein n=1 Tax=Kitasatospora sp. McL0602 TaxID=3439530 RepID=UPI003F8BBAAA
MPICPRGHESQAEDWCDFCGFPMTAPPGVALPGAGTFGGSPAPAAPSHQHHQYPQQHAQPQQPYGQQQPQHPQAQQSPQGQHPQQHGQQHNQPQVTAGLVTCPICRTPQTGRYCEECGYDFDLSAPSQRQPSPGGNLGGYGYPQPAPAGPPPAQANPYSQPTPYPPAAPPVAPAAPAAPASPYQQAPGFPQANGFPEAEGCEHSGPVYAQPGPGGPGDDFGTSFRLAPPGSTPPPPTGLPAQQPVRTTWMAVVSADRDYFTDMMARSGPEAAGLFFPPYCPERRIPLTGRGQLRIGRRSQHRGTVPEIDLSVPPEDPGASHQHAMLAEQADGSWVLVDQDSTNGTTVNGGPDPVPPHTAIPLADGDRIHIGAWTTITLHRS